MSASDSTLSTVLKCFRPPVLGAAVVCLVFHWGQTHAAGIPPQEGRRATTGPAPAPAASLAAFKEVDGKTSLNKIGDCGLALPKAVELALARNPEIMSAAAVIRREDANIAVAEAARYPQVSLGSDLLGSGSRNISGSRNLNNVNLTADLLLFDFGKTGSQINSALSSKERAQEDMNVTAEKISVDTARAFLGVIRAVAIRRQAEAYAHSLSKLKEIIRLRVRAGVADMADLIFAEVRADASESAVVDAMAQERSSISSLYNLTGESFTCFQKPDAVLASIDRAVSLNDLDLHPAVISAERTADKFRHDVAAQRAALLPRIGLQARQQYADSPLGPSAKKGDFSVMLTLRMDLYQGGAGAARVEYAEAEQDATFFKKNVIKMNAVNEFGVAAEDVIASKLRVPIIRSMIEGSVRSRDIFFAQYTLKKKSLIDILVAEAEVNDAYNRMIETENIWALAVVQKAGAVGSLRKKMGMLDSSPESK